MRTLLIGLPHAMAVRNVLRTETFAVLRREPHLRIVIASPLSREAEFREEFDLSNVRFVDLPDYAPRVVERLVMNIRLAQMSRGSSTAQLLLAERGGIRRGLSIVYNKVEGIVGRARLGRFLDSIELRCIAGFHQAEVFDRYSPDLVIATRLSGWSGDTALVKQASLRNIPTIALVSSWDNLSSKPFLPAAIDSLVVWNPIMRDEAVDLYGFPEEKIYMSGVPRFDVYFRQRVFRTREELFALLGLDPKMRLVTYTTGHKRLFWPYDGATPEPDIVSVLSKAVDENLFPDSVQILVRLHPQADPTDYAHLDRQDGRVRVHVPGRDNVCDDRDFSTADDILLAETMLHSDVVVNVASTITIDAAVFGTPIVCVGFDPRGGARHQDEVKKFYRFEHYRKLLLTGACRVVHSPGELIAEVREYLIDPARDQASRARLVEQQCFLTDGLAGLRVAEYILATAEGRATQPITDDDVVR